MTISYSGNFAKLLLRWKGSLWKTVWKELLVFLSAFYLIRILYHHLLNDAQRLTVEKLIFEFDEYTERIPIMFLLGFYVATVVKRWWEQFEWLGWPDDVLSVLCFIVPLEDEDSEILRRAVGRYLNLTAALAWREISKKVRKRFPTVDHLMTAGMMTSEERQIYQRSEVNSRWFLPIHWIQSLVQDHCEKNNTPAPLVSHFLDKLHRFRNGFRELHCYDWVCIPLVYTQVAAIATYGYFILCLIGRQFIDSRSVFQEPSNGGHYKARVDYYIPVFTILEFLFYVGWFKVGQDLMRPFEEDDDDFELNYLLDRHIQVSAAMAGPMCSEIPTLPSSDGPKRDKPDLFSVPHTRISAQLSYHPPKLHAYIHVKSPTEIQPAEPFLLKSPDKDRKLRYF